jgi:hypothetical protein
MPASWQGGDIMSDITHSKPGLGGRVAVVGAGIALIAFPFTALLLIFAAFFALRPRVPWQY